MCHVAHLMFSNNLTRGIEPSEFRGTPRDTAPRRANSTVYASVGFDKQPPDLAVLFRGFEAGLLFDVTEHEVQVRWR